MGTASWRCPLLLYAIRSNSRWNSRRRFIGSSGRHVLRLGTTSPPDKAITPCYQITSKRPVSSEQHKFDQERGLWNGPA